MEKMEKSLEEKYSESLKEIENLKKEIADFKEMLDYLRRQKFGPKSEKTSKIIDPKQMSFFDEAEAIKDEEENKSQEIDEEDLIEVKTHKRKNKSTRKDKISEDIPHEKRLIPLEEDICDKMFKQAGNNSRRIRKKRNRIHTSKPKSSRLLQTSKHMQML